MKFITRFLFSLKVAEDAKSSEDLHWRVGIFCKFRYFKGLWAILLFFASTLRGADIPPDQIEFFETKIRPVLAQECYECHNSRGKSKAGLILDHRDALLAGGDSGPAIVPGKAGKSLLIEAIKHLNDLTMPKAGVKLDPPIIADFERWINMGAPDPRDKAPTDAQLAVDTNWEAIFTTRQNWWSFQPVKNPAVPAGDGTAIDRFVVEKLEEQQLPLSRLAPARTLARRLNYALIGLPPTPQELDQFEQESEIDRANATNNLIDTLLDSPRFGERWARHWMDWVRYAESHGSEGDPAIPNAYYYRDYLIRALNEDIGYDQLLTEHVAGDLLEKPRLNESGRSNESLLGAIHWRMVFHGFAPTDALDEKVRFTDDQINTFSKAFQGLTVSCARCHDHKFDAISQADYYALFGILGSTRPGMRLIETEVELEKNKSEIAHLKPKIRKAIAKHWLTKIGGVSELLLQKKPDPKEAKDVENLYHLFSQLSQNRPIEGTLEKLQNGWKRDVSNPILEWDLTDPAVYQKWYQYGNGLPPKPLPAGSFQISSDGAKQVVDAVLPAGIYSNDVSNKHAARLTSEEFQLRGDTTLYVQAIGGGGSRSRYVVQNYPRNGTVFKVNQMSAKDGKPLPWQWHTYQLGFWEGDAIHIELSTGKDSAVLTNGTDRSWFGIRRAMLLDKEAPHPKDRFVAEYLQPVVAAMGDEMPKTATELAGVFERALQQAIDKWGREECSDGEALLLDQAIRHQLLPNTLEGIGEEAERLVLAFRELENEITIPTRVPGIDEWKGADQPLFERGDHKKPLEPVSRRFLETVDDSPYKTSQSGRLQLAEDLLRPDNPFTRRVIVNRIWTHLFGEGIVGSVDNFGRLGEKPSHPELLDYLATRFDSHHGWSIKSLIREIVQSQTWQQSSVIPEAARTVDPKNRLLSHYPIRRLEAEAIRDTMLKVAGQLDDNMYGPAVDGRTPRRSVYVRVIRNRLDPFLGVFDAPIPFSTTGKRPITNVPAQSLTMLNDSQVTNYAKAFAARFSGSDQEKIKVMWSAALCREPAEKEVAVSVQFLRQLRSKSDEISVELDLFRKQVTTVQAENSALLDPIRKRLTAELSLEKPVDNKTFGSVASWDFTEGTTDLVGGLKGRLSGNAKVKNGALVLDGNSSFFSDPLGVDLKEKTLEVVVTLDTLNQKAGGVLTVQDLRGNVFDSIVFAERKSNEWLAGSNNHKRTSDFGGAPESEAVNQSTHLAIAYDADGTIRAYRNGEVYGKAYQSSGPVTYTKNAAQVVLGLRHGTGNGGNRNLSGKILEARVYDRALEAHEIASLAAGKRIISKKQILDELSESQRKQVRGNETEIAKQNVRINELAKEGSGLGEAGVWQSFGHSLFNLKEFIYIY